MKKDYGFLRVMSEHEAMDYVSELFRMGHIGCFVSSDTAPLDLGKVCIKGDGTEERGKKIISYLVDFYGGKSDRGFSGASVSYPYYFVGATGGIDHADSVPEGYSLVDPFETIGCVTHRLKSQQESRNSEPVKELNLAEILKDAQKGTKLYSPIFGEVILNNVYSTFDDIAIEVNAGPDYTETFTNNGRYTNNFNGECLLFPSKDQRDWSKFKVEPICEFEDGEVCTCSG